MPKSTPSPSKENIYTSIDYLRRLQHKAKGFSFQRNQPVNSTLSGVNVSKLRGRGLNFEELRQYRPGDDIRSMDWKVTRRTGKPHVKVYTEEKERNVYLAIDQRQNMFFGSTHKMKSVIAAELAALIAWRVTDSGDRIGALIYNDESTHVIPAKRGKQHVINVLSELTKKNHALKVDDRKTDEATSLNTMLKKLQNTAKNNALIILIGDGYGWNDSSSDYLKRLRQHNEIIACHIYDPLELNLPKMSQMIVSDGLQQIQFSSLTSSIQNAYSKAMQEQLARYSETAKKNRIPLITIDTLEPVEAQLRKAMGQVQP